MRNESNPFGDGKESSGKKEDKDSRREEKRWVPTPLIPPGRIPGLRPPQPETQKTDSEEDDEDDEDDKEKKPESSKDQSKEESQDEKADQAEAEQTEVANEEDGERPVTEETTPEGVVEESAPEIAEEPANDEPEETGVLHIRRDNEVNKPESTPADNDEADTATPTPPLSAGSTAPPRPPIFPPNEARPYGTPEDPEPEPASNAFMASRGWGTSPNTYNAAPAATTEQNSRERRYAEEAAEKRGLRRGLVAGFITGYVLKAYLANKKHERYEKAVSKKIDQREEQISYLQIEQQKLSEQLAARAEEYRQRQEQRSKPESAGGSEKPAAAEALPPVKTAEAGQIFDQEGNEIILQPGWRVERSTGGYSVVLDEHNRVVHNAIHYGEAFKHDQKREQLSEDLFAAVGASSPFGDISDGATGPMPQTGPMPGAQYGAPASQQPTVDLNHRLPKPRNQVVATVASPWLWTAIAILIIVYFIAALA